MRTFVAVLLALASTAALQQGAGATEDLTCADFPTQINVAGSNFGEFDSTNFDENNDGIGCEANPGPPTAYDLTSGSPVAIPQATTTTSTPVSVPETVPDTVPSTVPGPPPATPVVTTPDFTG